MPSRAELSLATIRVAAAVSARLGGALAYRAFFATAPRMPIRPVDAPTVAQARRRTLRVGAAEVTVYEWGSPAGTRSTDTSRTALLLHGWRGRAAQFATIVRMLLADGFRVVALDAPGHGESGGSRTDVRDWVEASQLLHVDAGRFDLIVGHSFGAFAALTMARTTVPTARVVAIAGAPSPAAFIDEFARALRLPDAASAQLWARFAARFGTDRDGIGRRFDAVAHPLPASTELLVIHDRADPQVPDRDAVLLHRAHGARSRLLRTSGLGHSKILGDAAVLDALRSFAVRGVDGLPHDDQC